MDIDEVQCAYGGNVGRVSFQTQYMCGGEFEGVNMGSPLVIDAVTRVKERHIFLLCAVLREYMCWLFDGIGHTNMSGGLKCFKSLNGRAVTHMRKDLDRSWCMIVMMGGGWASSDAASAAAMEAKAEGQ